MVICEIWVLFHVCIFLVKVKTQNKVVLPCVIDLKTFSLFVVKCTVPSKYKIPYMQMYLLVIMA